MNPISRRTLAVPRADGGEARFRCVSVSRGSTVGVKRSNLRFGFQKSGQGLRGSLHGSTVNGKGLPGHSRIALTGDSREATRGTRCSYGLVLNAHRSSSRRTLRCGECRWPRRNEAS